MDWLKFLQENWMLITQAPWAFGTCAVLFLGLGLLLEHWRNSGVVAAKEERVKLAENRVADYKDKAEGRSPEELAKLIARVEALEYKTLSPKAIEDIYSAVEKYRYAVEIPLSVSSQKLEPLHRQLVSAFTSSGWNVSEWVTMGEPERPHSDISLVVGENTSPEIAQAIRVAFAKAGVEYSEVSTRDVRSIPQIWISSARA